MPAELEVTVHGSLAEIPAQDWDSVACPESADGGRPVDPFTTYRFLAALERSGSTGTGTGWQARPLVARQDGRIIARGTFEEVRAGVQDFDRQASLLGL